MKDNKLIIRINKSPDVVFNYYINPRNTPLWWDYVTREETSDWPLKIGTKYRSKSKKGVWSEYTVTCFKENELFELESSNKNYHVRWTNKLVGENATELTYYEWVDSGELEEPFTLEILGKLKKALEGQTNYSI